MSNTHGKPRWRRIIQSPYFWIGLPIAWVIVAYILYPSLSLLHTSVTDRATKSVTVGNFTVFFDLKSPYFIAFLRSLKVAAIVLVLTTAMGTALAFLLTRYDFPGRGVMYAMSVMPLVMPGFVAAYAYIMLYGKYGFITRLGTLITTGQLGEATHYLDSFAGVVALQTIGFMPLMFLTISAVMGRLDPAMEEASLSLGASRMRTFFKVTLPLLAPGIAAGGILVLARSMASFGGPLFMGYETFTVAIFKAKVAGEANIAAAMSVLLSMVSLVVLFGIRSYLQRRDYAGTRQRAALAAKKLHGWRQAAATGVAALFAVVTLIPLAMIVLMSLTDVQRWSVHSLIPPPLHLRHYVHLFSGSLLRPLRNTLIFASVSTVLAVAYGTLTAYVLSRRQLWGKKIFDAVVTAPYVIPSTVLGVAYITAFNRPTAFSFGTVWVATPIIMIAALFIQRSAYVIRSVVASFEQMDPSVEEAALSLGASWAYGFRRVTIPMIMPGLIAGGMLSFITGVAELSTGILLYTSKTTTIPIMLYQLVYNSAIGQASALGMLQVTIVVIALIITSRTVGLRSLRV